MDINHTDTSILAHNWNFINCNQSQSHYKITRSDYVSFHKWPICDSQFGLFFWNFITCNQSYFHHIKSDNVCFYKWLICDSQWGGVRAYSPDLLIDDKTISNTLPTISDLSNLEWSPGTEHTILNVPISKIPWPNNSFLKHGNFDECWHWL